MRNREKIIRMKEYIPEYIEDNPLSQEPKNSDIAVLKEKYSQLVEQWPVVGLRLEAIEVMSKKARYASLSDDEKETLLVHSLWTEDPVRVIEATKEIGFDERRINGYVDIAEYELRPLSDALMKVVDDLRRASEPVIVTPIDNGDGYNRTQLPPVKPIHSYTDIQPASNRTTQTYDHPIPTREQEKIIFEHRIKGSTIQELMENTQLRATIKAEDVFSWGKVLGKSNTIDDLIINTSLRFVDVIARAYKNHGVSHVDLINAGNIGVIYAMRRYKPEGPANFVGYAKYAIRGEIIKAVRNAADINIPARIRSDLNIVYWVSDAFRTVLGREATVEELRTQLLANTDLSVYRIDTTLEAFQSKAQYARSMNETITSDSEDELADFIPDKTVDLEGDLIAAESKMELKIEVHRAIHQYLTERERDIIRRLFGIGYGAEIDPEEVARVTGLMRDEVDIIKARALVRLRRDEILKAHWDGLTDIPYFVYRASAERAAFRLGLFSEGYIERERLKKALLQPEESVIYQQPSQELLQVEDQQTQVIASPVVAVSPEPEDSRTSGEKIVMLLDQGLSMQEIADQLGVKLASAHSILSRFRKQQQQGRIATRLPRLKTETPPPAAVKEKEEKEETLIAKVKRLRNEGYNNQQITEMTGSTYGAVGQCAVRLLKRGEIKPLSKTKKSTQEEIERAEKSKRRIASRLVVVAPRIEGETYYNHIKELFKQGLSYREIGLIVSRKTGTVGNIVRKLISLGELEPVKFITREEMKQTAVSEETELVRQYLEEHPRLSNKESLRLIFAARQSRPRGKRPETTEFERQVKELRQGGLENKQIAAQLSTNIPRVQSAVHSLIEAGELTPRLTIKDSKDRATKIAYAKEFSERVKVLCLQGFNKIQIAAQLEDSAARVAAIMSKLEKDGEVKLEYRQLKPLHQAGYYMDRGKFVAVGDTYKIIAEMRNNGATNEEVTKRLGIPKHRAEIYASNLIKAGVIKSQRRIENKATLIAQIIILRKQGLRNQEIAETLGQPVNRIHNMAKKLIDSGEIQPAKHRATTKR